MTAAKEKPASWAGYGAAKSSKSLYSKKISQDSDSVKLPEWMAEKLSKIAAKQDVWELEQQEITILASMIRCFPQQAEKLPNSFCNKILAQKPREMEDLERAAVIIVAFDWKAVADILGGASLDVKVAAHFDALDFALRMGGEPWA